MKPPIALMNEMSMGIDLEDGALGLAKEAFEPVNTNHGYQRNRTTI